MSPDDSPASMSTAGLDTLPATTGVPVPLSEVQCGPSDEDSFRQDTSQTQDGRST